MNLYWVYPSGDDYGLFIFEETRNKARIRGTHYFTDNEAEDYVNMRAILKKKDAEVQNSIIIDHPSDPNYKLVTDLGFGYREESEYEQS